MIHPSVSWRPASICAHGAHTKLSLITTVSCPLDLVANSLIGKVEPQQYITEAQRIENNQGKTIGKEKNSFRELTLYNLKH